MPPNEHLADLRKRVLREAPRRPGVYTWFGPDREVLYIGKSRNLRSRMVTYLAPGETAFDGRHRHLAYSIRDFAVRETPGELLALLLEDALIKQHNPRHNERQRDYRERCFLRLPGTGRGRCAIVENECGNREMWGPFKDRFFVAGLIELLEEEFGLGATLQLGRYRPDLEPEQSLSLATAFLEGDDGWLVSRLAERMGAASEELQFEVAAATLERLRFVQRFASRQRFLRRWRTQTVRFCESSSGLAYTFTSGVLTRLQSGATSLAIPPELLLADPDLRRADDRAHIVYACMKAGTVVEA